jgi:hypothetical protein
MNSDHCLAPIDGGENLMLEGKFLGIQKCPKEIRKDIFGII